MRFSGVGFYIFFNSQRCFIWTPYSAETVTAPETAIGEKKEEKKERNEIFPSHADLFGMSLVKNSNLSLIHI